MLLKLLDEWFAYLFFGRRAKFIYLPKIMYDHEELSDGSQFISIEKLISFLAIEEKLPLRCFLSQNHSIVSQPKNVNSSLSFSLLSILTLCFSIILVLVGFLRRKKNISKFDLLSYENGFMYKNVISKVLIY